jgi:hypothetical protein
MSGNTGITKAISFSVVLIGIAVFYYYVIFLPKQEQAKLDFQKQQEQTRIDLQKNEQQAADDKTQKNRSMLQECLYEADLENFSEWENNCKTRGLKSGCSLPMDLAESIGEDLKEAKDFCFKQYPQK